jgi:16S rRNA (adenine1518-N6/adenine1519-N6)-dimethyltransferase
MKQQEGWVVVDNVFFCPLFSVFCHLLLIMPYKNQRLKKSLGQVFLENKTELKHIVDIAEVKKGEPILEIGAGSGNLTELLAGLGAKVLALEIDQRFCKVLNIMASRLDNITVLCENILNIEIKDIINKYFKGAGSIRKGEISNGVKKIKVIANLPYYITTPVLFKLIENRVYFNSIVVMVQKEVAERMTAMSGSKKYGSLSVAVQYYMDVKLERVVLRSNFTPRPNVDSALVKLKPRLSPLVKPLDEDGFFKMIRAIFNQRRKMLRNNLLSLGFNKDIIGETFEKISIDEKVRGEDLSIEKLCKVSDGLIKQETEARSQESE